MDNLYIQVENSVPVNHPAYEDNLIQAFGEIPSTWVPFVRVDAPILDVYEKFDTSYGHEGCGCEYAATDDGFKDVWHAMDMSIAEKTSKINTAKLNIPKFITTWLFDEATCQWNPPVAYPVDISDPDAAIYAWRDSDTSWIEITTTRPENGVYYFNVNTATWTEVSTAPSETGYVFNTQTGAWVDE